MNLTCLNTSCPENTKGTHCSNERVVACFNRVRPEEVSKASKREIRKTYWLETFCWNCGEKNELCFSVQRSMDLYESSCPACGNKICIFREDLLEIYDRRTKRGIP